MSSRIGCGAVRLLCHLMALYLLLFAFMARCRTVEGSGWPSCFQEMSGSVGWTQVGSPEVGVPSQYRDLYYTLDSKLGDILSYVNSQWDGRTYAVNFAAELIAANGHRGEELLKPDSIQGVAFMIDRLKSLGVKGVKVAVKYPLLRPDFPNSNGYLEFYKKVSQEVKKRSLVLYVATGTAFRDPAFTSLRVDYSGLTFGQFKLDMRQYVDTVLNNLQPDYLTITNEPETQEMNTGLDFSVQNVKELVEYVLDGLDRKGALIGAGSGTWDKIEYFQALAQIPGLDYLDMHIYPINRDFVVDRAFRMAEIVKTSKKKLVLSEAWLYKVRDKELGTATATSAQLFARDVFSFWAPLDERFVETVAKLAHLLRIEFCSFFWMQYFYSYLEYDEQKNAMKPAQLFALVNSEAAKNILSNTLSTTGARFKSLIAPMSTETQSYRTTTTETPPRQEPALVRQLLVGIIAIVAISAVVVATVTYFRRKKR